MPTVSAHTIAKVRAYTEGNMDGLVTILRAGGVPQMDPVTLEVGGMAGAKQIYGDPVPDGQIGTTGGKARVHPFSNQGSISLGPGQIDQRSGTISIPWGAPVPQKDDVVLIRDAGQDTDLNGVAARIIGVSGGGLFGECRRLQCVVWGRSSTWDGVAP